MHGSGPSAAPTIVYNDFYGTDEERNARDAARRALAEGRDRNRLETEQATATPDDVKSALADIGIDL